MNCRITVSTGLVGCVAALGWVQCGCNQTIVANLTKEKTGNITVSFNNTTDFAAGFSYGTWDEWDRSPGAVNFRQLSVDGHAVSSQVTIACARNLAVGTQLLYDRVVDTKADDTTSFIPEIFDTVVHFSQNLEDSSTTGLPTAGTAEGLELLLGVDYSCGDQVIFTFVEDPDAPGGYRIDHEVIQDRLPNE
jgi:hypothetical protein